MDTLFALVEDRPISPEAVREPIGRPQHRRRRPRPRGGARPAGVRTLVLEQRRDLAQLVTIMRGLAADLAEQRELFEPIFRHLVELRRAVGATELHRPERQTRRRPLG